MAKDSKIEWTHHTFNPWWGCTKVSPACEHCYAETWAKRTGQKVWGKRAPRRTFGDAHWRDPVKWNADADERGERARVFCASMADVFEHRGDLDVQRARLWQIIDETPWLDWLLLTKRPEHVASAVPWGATWPSNVWLGTTVEDQKWAARRVPALLAVPAKVHFVSCEPLLGPLDLTDWLGRGGLLSGPSSTIDWVIAGGESGGRARPMQQSWVRSLRDQCLASGAPFHFKQWGEWRPLIEGEAVPPRRRAVVGGEDVVRAGKVAAGRVLDGRAWNGLPRLRAPLGDAHTPRRRLAIVA